LTPNTVALPSGEKWEVAHRTSPEHRPMLSFYRRRIVLSGKPGPLFRTML
jgi:hypothetical protein